MSSLSRLMERRKVDFPHPDGPMSAVTSRGAMARLMSNSACVFPYQKLKPSTSMVPPCWGAATSGDVAVALIRNVQ